MSGKNGGLNTVRGFRDGIGKEGGRVMLISHDVGHCRETETKSQVEEKCMWSGLEWGPHALSDY